MPVKKKPHILVVDDEHFILGALQLYFESNDFFVSTASEGEEALRLFRAEHDSIDVVILDLVMPGTHGLDLLRAFKETNAEVQVVIATGCGSMGSAIEALRLGAFDFITKPILDFDTDLMKSVRRALEARMRTKLESSQSGIEDTSSWNKTYEKLDRFARERIGKAPDTEALSEVWRLLHQDMGASAAALMELQGETWQAIHAWNFSEDDESVDWKHRVSASLPKIGVDWSTSGQILNDDSPDQDHQGSTWRRIQSLPLWSMGSERRTLALFYNSQDPRLDGPAASSPLALLSTVLSPVLAQVESRSTVNAMIPELERDTESAH